MHAVAKDSVTAPDWVRLFYDAVDANDGTRALAQMAPEISLQFGARPAVAGRDAAAATLRAVHAHFERVSHTFRNIWETRSGVICEFVAVYLLHDGSRLPLPTLTVLERADGQITSMRVYIDEGALTGPLTEPSSRHLSSGW
jgi:ketosteroid isomerase-like protein